MKINDGDIDVAVASWVPLDRQFFSLFHFYKWAEGGTSENTARMQMLWPSLMTDPIKRSAPQRLTLNEMSSVVSLRRLLQFSEKKSMRSMQMIRTKDENEKGAEMADATASVYIWPKFWVQVNAWACTGAAVPIQRRHHSTLPSDLFGFPESFRATSSKPLKVLETCNFIQINERFNCYHFLNLMWRWSTLKYSINS